MNATIKKKIKYTYMIYSKIKNGVKENTLKNPKKVINLGHTRA